MGIMRPADPYHIEKALSLKDWGSYHPQDLPYSIHRMDDGIFWALWVEPVDKDLGRIFGRIPDPDKKNAAGWVYLEPDLPALKHFMAGNPSTGHRIVGPGKPWDK